MNRALFLILVGLGGAAILVALGIWQVQRLAWKEGILADINARIEAAPVEVPGAPDPDADRYLPVRLQGYLKGETLRVLVSQKDVGAGYRLITAAEAGDRRVLIDRGFVPTEAPAPDLPDTQVTVTGNLQWPQETDSFTPAPDLANNIWFARDVVAMAEALGTAPILIVARDVAPPEPKVAPFPVDTSRIPNDHLQYAVTWFSLAVVWLAMTVFFLRRRPRAHTSERKT